MNPFSSLLFVIYVIAIRIPFHNAQYRVLLSYTDPRSISILKDIEKRNPTASSIICKSLIDAFVYKYRASTKIEKQEVVNTFHLVQVQQTLKEIITKHTQFCIMQSEPNIIANPFWESCHEMIASYLRNPNSPQSSSYTANLDMCSNGQYTFNVKTFTGIEPIFLNRVRSRFAEVGSDKKIYYSEKLLFGEPIKIDELSNKYSQCKRSLDVFGAYIDSVYGTDEDRNKRRQIADVFGLANSDETPRWVLSENSKEIAIPSDNFYQRLMVGCQPIIYELSLDADLQLEKVEIMRTNLEKNLNYYLMATVTDQLAKDDDSFYKWYYKLQELHGVALWDDVDLETIQTSFVVNERTSYLLQY